MDIRRQHREILSWRLATEIVRHAPKELRILELHPGGWMYDVLAVVHLRAGQLLHLNRNGSIHAFKTLDGLDLHESEESITWDRVVAVENPKRIVEDLGKRIRLPMLGKLPCTTPPVLVYRMISAFLAHAAGGRIQWRCCGGSFDTSGYGGGPQEEWFNKFPAASERCRIPMVGDFLDEPSYRFWFLLRNEEPVFCMEATGVGWDLKDRAFDLVKLYKATRRIWPVLAQVLGDQLP